MEIFKHNTLKLTGLALVVLTFTGCGGSDNEPPAAEVKTEESVYAPVTLTAQDITMTVNHNSMSAEATRTYTSDTMMFTRVSAGDFDRSTATYQLSKNGEVLTEIAEVFNVNGNRVQAFERETSYTFTDTHAGTWVESVEGVEIKSGAFTLRDTPFKTNAAGDISDIIAHAGVSRNMHIHLPVNFDATEKSALIIVFHGAGGNGPRMRNISQLNQVSDEHLPVVLYTDSLSTTLENNRQLKLWDISGQQNDRPFNDIDYVTMMIDKAVAEYNVDPEKVFISGFSNGSFFVNRLLCEVPELFAGAAINSGNMFSQAIDSCSLTAVPIIHTHATEDPVLPFSGDPVGLMSIDDSLNFYAEKNGCELEAQQSEIDNINNDDDSTVTLFTYQHCDEATPLVHYRVHGEAHTWAGSPIDHGEGDINQDINWSELQWQFFSKL